MIAPRLDIDLAKIEHNARTLIERLGRHGIVVTGVTKATLGSPEIAAALLRAGVVGRGDTRQENKEALRGAGVVAPLTLIRSPMPSQIDRVVAAADVSFNTELGVITRLSEAAGRRGVTHGIVLMVELGDLREGILPDDLDEAVRATLGLPHLAFRGIGTNLACRSGVVPDDANMGELSDLAEAIEKAFDVPVEVVSGGNSGNLTWALGAGPKGRVNDLRLGESVLLGCEPLHRRPLDGLHTDAITLVAEVIESKRKPSQPWGDTAQAAFGLQPRAVERGDIVQTIVAVGHQDVDPDGVVPPHGVAVLGASSDHLVVETGAVLPPGTQLAFGVNYSALVRAMTSPFVTKVFHHAPRMT
jgi:predicted amino acid racemase